MGSHPSLRAACELALDDSLRAGGKGTDALCPDMATVPARLRHTLSSRANFSSERFRLSSREAHSGTRWPVIKPSALLAIGDAPRPQALIITW
jgi:hypothetical protein